MSEPSSSQEYWDQVSEDACIEIARLDYEKERLELEQKSEGKTKNLPIQQFI